MGFLAIITICFVFAIARSETVKSRSFLLDFRFQRNQSRLSGNKFALMLIIFMLVCVPCPLADTFLRPLDLYRHFPPLVIVLALVATMSNLRRICHSPARLHSMFNIFFAYMKQTMSIFMGRPRVAIIWDSELDDVAGVDWTGIDEQRAWPHTTRRFFTESTR